MNIMNIPELLRIKAIGNLLEYYYSDLVYIRNFQNWKRGKILSDDFLSESPGTFRSFLNEYRVTRNIQKGKIIEVLKITMEWVNKNIGDDVDRFAVALNATGFTHGKQMTSLASKVLFLNNPWSIIPIDMWNKKALGVKTNRYCDFQKSLNSRQIDCSFFQPEQQYLSTIEGEFEADIDNLADIRKNRFLDKLLWTVGQQST